MLNLSNFKEVVLKPKIHNIFDFKEKYNCDEVIIYDIEFNGWSDDKRLEILEFSGIKLKNNQIIDVYSFKCKHKNYEMHPIAKKNTPYLYDEEEYNSRKYVDYYIEDLIDFFGNCTKMLSWETSSDKKVLHKVLNDFGFGDLYKKFSFADVRTVIKKHNKNAILKSLSKSFLSIKEKETSSKDLLIGDNQINLNTIIDDKLHSSINDVLQIIYIMLNVYEEEKDIKEVSKI